MTQQTFLIMNGPNLNMLGVREPETYGSVTLKDIEKQCRSLAEPEYKIIFEQFNNEGDIIVCLQALCGQLDGIIINPAAFTHTSVAIRDALLLHDCPIVEVHLSNIHTREPFRHHSYISDIAEGVICGLGAHGYQAALQHLMEG